jgi:hypothetical protein
MGCGLLVSFTASASVDANKFYSVATYHPKPLIAPIAPDVSRDEVEPFIIVPSHIGLGPEFSEGHVSAPRFQEKLGSKGEERVATLKKSDPWFVRMPSFDGQTPATMDDNNGKNILVVSGSNAITESDGKVTVLTGLTPRAGSSLTTPTVSGAMTLSVALTAFGRSDAAAVETVRGSGALTIISKPLPPLSAAHSIRPDFARLIAPAEHIKEQRCLTEAVYFEARSEPEQGQAAVAQVVLNRLSNELYPKTICEVVYQNQDRFLGCEFTFACEGKSLVINDAESWATAERLALKVLNGEIYNPDVGEATHYHADYVRPYWAKALDKRDVIGHHIFYSLKPGLPGGICPGCLLAKAAG